MFTKYGMSTLLTCLIIAIILITFGYVFTETLAWLGFLSIGLGIFLAAFSLNFFRDPHRETEKSRDSIVSPADGKVVLIKDIPHDEFIGGPAKLIAVFMSPLNVHVNRIPMDGKVTFLKYCPGLFIKAWEDKASDVNERSEIGIENGKTKVLFKQISGFVARRIIFSDLKEGQDVKKGERFGMIKFGSRVDIVVPANYKIEATINQITRAGESVIARIPS